MNYHERAKVLLDPILDVIGGSDGGVAFTKLRHQFIPDILRMSNETHSQAATDMVTSIERFSKLCNIMLESRNKNDTFDL